MARPSELLGRALADTFAPQAAPHRISRIATLISAALIAPTGRRRDGQPARPPLSPSYPPRRSVAAPFTPTAAADAKRRRTRGDSVRRSLLLLSLLLGWLAAFLFTASGPAYAQSLSPRPSPAASHDDQDGICRVCGLYIQRFKRTAVHLQFKNGQVEACCGIACAIRIINEHGGFSKVASADITAWDTREQIPMRSATYVIGSRVIPDTLPNVIGFSSDEAARRFVAEKGGKITPLDELDQSTSYRGLTAPFRIPPAAVPPGGVLNVNATYNSRHRDGLLRNHATMANSQGLASSPLVPTSMKMTTAATQIGYAATDDVFVALTVPEHWKSQKTLMRNATMGNGTMRNAHTSGVGDVSLAARWRFWRDTSFDNHLGVYAEVTLPTGCYNPALRDMSSMQLGTGTYTVTPGLLYSKRTGQFWVHAAALYTLTTTNSDSYKFGNSFRGGLALHWVPNHVDLVGLEADYESGDANRHNGVKVASTGRAGAYWTLVYQRQLLLVGGGHMNVNLLYGGPFYQRVNDIQLGDSSHWGAGLQWQRRF